MNSGIESSFYTGGIPVKHPALGAREDYWLQFRLSTASATMSPWPLPFFCWCFQCASRLPDEHDWSRLHSFNNPYASSSNDRLTPSSREPRLLHLTLYLCLRPPGKARPPDT